MDENEVITPETPADQSDAFLEGRDDTPAAETPADRPENDAGQARDEAAADQPGAEDGADNADGRAAGEMPPDANAGQQQESSSAGDEGAAGNEAPATENTPPVSWTLRHLDDPEITITADDARIPDLLQKGLDYDRVRGKYDEAKPVIEVLGELAKQSGMDLAGYARYIRAEVKKAQGMGEAEAQRAVELEDREAAVSAKEAAENEATEAKNAADTKIRRDLEEFGRTFPKVYEQAKSEPKTIPQSVWDDVNRGISLTAAYSRYAVAQAEAKAASAEQRAGIAAANAKNAARSAGSMKSAGNDAKGKDPFLEGWDS